MNEKKFKHNNDRFLTDILLEIFLMKNLFAKRISDKLSIKKFCQYYIFDEKIIFIKEYEKHISDELSITNLSE